MSDDHKDIPADNSSVPDAKNIALSIRKVDNGVWAELSGDLLKKSGYVDGQRLTFDFDLNNAGSGKGTLRPAHPWEAAANLKINGDVGMLFFDDDTWARCENRTSGRETRDQDKYPQEQSVSLNGLEDLLAFRDQITRAEKKDGITMDEESRKALDTAIEEQQIARDFHFFCQTVFNHKTGRLSDGRLICGLKLNEQTEEMESVRRILRCLSSFVNCPGGEGRFRRIINKYSTKTPRWTKKSFKLVFALIRGFAGAIKDGANRNNPGEGNG